MSDKINATDRQTGLEMAWHNKTNVVTEVTRENAFPYDIERVPLFIGTLAEMAAVAAPAKKPAKTAEVVSDAKKPAKNAKTATPKMHLVKPIEVPGFTMLRCTDGIFIGKPLPESYPTMTHAKFWSICQDALAGTGAIVESAGTIMDRTRRFITIKLGDDSTEIGGRKFKNRIALIDSLDQTTNFFAINTSICVVCSNTVRAAIGDNSGEFKFKIRHTNNMPDAIEGMEKKLEAMLGVQAQFNAALAMAAEEPLKTDDARNLFAGWIVKASVNKAGGLSTRSKNTVDELVTLFAKGDGNKGETMLDGISAVTDFYTKRSSGGETDADGKENPDFRGKQYLSSEFGAGQAAKTDFVNRLFLTEGSRATGFDREAIGELQTFGTKLLKEYAASN